MRQNFEKEINNLLFVDSAMIRTKPTISTSDILRDIREAQEKLGPPPKKILYSSMCMLPTDKRLFPASRHRSARIRKKLIKRFGSEFFMKPTIIETSDMVIADTSFQGPIAEFERK